MTLLSTYLRNYTGLVALALALATINQVFSLLDPLVFRLRSSAMREHGRTDRRWPTLGGRG